MQPVTPLVSILSTEITVHIATANQAPKVVSVASLLYQTVTPLLFNQDTTPLLNEKTKERESMEEYLR